MSIIQTIDLTFMKEKIQTGIAVVQFHATWCKDCIYVKPLYEKLVEDNPKATYIDIDVDKCPEARPQFEIKIIPTFIMYQNGKELKRIWEPNYEQLEAFMEEAAKLE